MEIKQTRLTLLAMLLVTSFALMWFHTQALENFWYWIYPWFDILTHFIGGVVVAFAMVIMYLYYPLGTRILNEKVLKTLTVVYVLVVGVLWEVFEVLIRSTGPQEEHYFIDTISDLFVDVSGGLLVYLIVWFLFLRHHHE